MINRRNFLKAGLTFGAFGSLNSRSLNFVPGQNITTEDIEVSDLSIKNSKISHAFNGYKIGFISDTHCGVFLSQKLLDKTIEKIQAAAPDLLLLGGDYIGIPDNLLARFFYYLQNKSVAIKRTDKLVAEIFTNLGKSLEKLKAKDGILAVLGNHDNWNNSKVCIDVLSQYGIKFLINSEHTVEKNSEKLILYGVDDYWTGIPKISPSFLVNNSEQFKILLSHNPDFIAETIQNKKDSFDLALAGHTHGGQICINGLGAVAGYNIRHSKFGNGTLNINNKIIHTSRGIGVVDIPLRVNCKPEISMITLQSA